MRTGGVLVGDERVVGHIGHRIDRDIHRGGLGVAGSSGHRIGKCVGAVEVSIRRVGHRAVGEESHATVGTLGHAGHGSARTKRVVGQDIDRTGGVLVGGDRVIGDIRHRIDRDIHRGRLGVAGSGGHRIGKCVGSVEVSIRGVGDGAVSEESHRSAGTLGHPGHRSARTERIVGQDVDDTGGVLVGGERVVGHIDHRINRDIHRGGLGITGRRGHRVSK